MFFYVIFLFVLLWIVVSTIATTLHLPWNDPAPFFWLQGILGCSALFMTTGVLITQNRQDKLAEQRRHLDLQISLLTERKGKQSALIILFLAVYIQETQATQKML